MPKSTFKPVQKSILKPVLKEGQWVLLCHPKHEGLLAGVGTIHELISQFDQLPITLKDNHRSTVKQGVLFHRQVVAKRPTDKNRRLWARFTSLFVVGEATATIANLERLEQAGVPSVAPLFALEKRVCGFLVDSWLCYDYRAGVPCTAADIDLIIQFLHQMHAAGFKHGDPTWNNFLQDDAGNMFTIDTKAKPCTSHYDITTDFELLVRANKLKGVDIAALAKLDTTNFGHKLAVTYMRLKSVRSAVKNRIKKNRPKNG